MFKFKTTTIINTANAVDFNGDVYVDSAGANVPKFKEIDDQFFVAGSGYYKKDAIVSVYKRPYLAAIKEVATITVPAGTLGDLQRLTVTVKLVGKTLADYANVYQDFLKPISVDIVSTGNATNNAAAFVKAVKFLTEGYDNSWFTISSSGAVITLTAKSGYQRLSAEIQKVTDDVVTPVYTSIATSSVTVPGAIGFGDDAWMVQQVQIPTAENTGYFRILRTERPIMGGNYTQYTLRYKVPSGEDGVWNADKKSVTTHVFWVKSDLVASFESELEKVADINGVLSITGNTAIDNTGGSATSQLTVGGAVGAVTYVSDTTGVATVGNTGLVTAVADGSAVITVTDSVGNTASVTVVVSNT